MKDLLKNITPLDADCMAKVQDRFDNLIKPVGSLAKLEQIVGIYAGAVRLTEFDFPTKALLLFGTKADNDIHKRVLQAGMLGSKDKIQPIVLASGHQKVMDEAKFRVLESRKNGASVIAFGSSEQVGIAQVVLAALLLELDAADYVADKDKKAVQKLQADMAKMPQSDYIARLTDAPLLAIQTAIAQAAALRMPVVLDGMTSVLAAVLAVRQQPVIKEYLIASYRLPDSMQEQLLSYLELSEILNLTLDSEDGLGAVLSFSLIDAGVRAYNEMKTFAQAQVEYALEDL